ncbi:zinc finger protein 99-like [Achroia grisella]|uniref:zinc finger protein 99-like n=1 Tax=Achroia grisella TaxID=688607 RepID=UPI0027D31E9E|nr:zinc finger protein 99-like [Achroia grisella]
MVCYCCVKGCSNNSNDKKKNPSNNTSFHAFPTNQEQRIKWLRAIGRPNWEPPSHARICSAHFDYDQINHDSCRTRIKDDACPVNALPPNSNFEATFVEVCRICLATDLKMYSLENSPLKDYLQSIAGFNANSNYNIEGLPQFVCYECAAHLTRCYNLIERSMTAQATLLDIFAQNGQSDSDNEKNAKYFKQYQNETGKKKSRRMLSDGLTPNEIEMQKYFNIIKLTSQEQIEEWTKSMENTPWKSDTVYKCEVCSKIFAHISTYRSHIIRHDPSRGKAECPICKLRFKNIVVVRSHTNRAHGKKFHCKSCPKVFSNVAVAKKHQKWHSGYQYSCGYCSFRSVHESALGSHVRVQHRHQLACTRCGRPAATSRGLRLHRAAAHHALQVSTPAPRPAGGHVRVQHRHQLACTRCGDTSRGLRLHRAAAHHALQHRHQLACTRCGRPAATSRGLRLHRAAAHHALQVSTPAPRPAGGHVRVQHRHQLACTRCGRPAATSRGLRLHRAAAHHALQVSTPAPRPAGGHVRVQHRHQLACTRCGRPAATSRGLRLHRAAAHHALQVSTPAPRPAGGHVRVQHRHQLACTRCGRPAATSRGLRLHRAAAHHALQECEDSEAFPCEQCHLNFSSEGARRVHILTSKQHRQKTSYHNPNPHEDVPRNTCKFCGLDFPTATEVLKHTRAEHRKLRKKKTSWRLPDDLYPTQCEHCDIRLESRGEHWQHVRRQHPRMTAGYRRVITAVCHVCGKGFQNKTKLELHALRHGRPTVRCRECGRACYDKHALARHAATHAPHRPHACARCGRAFKLRSNLLRHARVHTTATPYECTMCGKKFKYSTSVNLHVRTVHYKLPHPPRKKRTNKSTTQTEDNIDI